MRATGRFPLLALILAGLAGCIFGATQTAGGAARPAFDGRRAFAHLQRQCAFGPRVPGSKGHDQCLAYLLAELRKSADQVQLQPFSLKVRGKRLALTNLIAIFNPSAEGGVLLCAHWDTRPTADREPRQEDRRKPILGANDGASGVAVLLELARLLKARPPRQQVTLVLFDGEDYGLAEEDMLLGSRHFAERFTGPKPEWAALLDMVGARGMGLQREWYSRRFAPEVVERIWGIARRLGVAEFEEDDGPAIVDDHVPLLQAGILCIDLIDVRYPHWHRLSDTPDKCSTASLEAVGKVLWAALNASNSDGATTTAPRP